MAVTQSVTKPGPPSVGRAEHAGQQRAEDAADRVHAEHVERVVGAEHALQPVDAPQADEARGEADHERARDADVAGGRRDRDQARDRARSGAEHRGLALEHPLAEASTRAPRRRSRGRC